MLNLKTFNEDCLTVYKTAITRKRDDHLHHRLEVIEEDIISAYKLYIEKFKENNIELIPVNNIFNPHLEDLKSLYKFSSFIIRRVKKIIDDLQPYPLGNTFQNCTINSVNSMDHVLAQANYAEYSVHPLNLFPSCTECNNYKNASFTKNGHRRFLNLYSDNLPNQQYLFVDIFNNVNGNLDWKFVVENKKGIEANTFSLIKNHFDELNLFDRMKFGSIKYYGEFRNSIKSRLKDVSWEKIIIQIKNEVSDNMKNLGTNHFHYILQLAMIENDLFRNSFAE